MLTMYIKLPQEEAYHQILPPVMKTFLKQICAIQNNFLKWILPTLKTLL